MKALAVVLMSTLLTLGLVVGAGAQTTGQPGSGTANPETKADNPTDRRNDPAPQSGTPQVDTSTRVRVPGPAGERPDVNVDVRTGRDDGSALPRQTPRETPGLLGLSPTTVALLTAALFIIVVLAVVAMTRSGGASGTRIDVDRRP
jgi:hypothetical protein